MTSLHENILSGYIAGIRSVTPANCKFYYLSTQMTSGKRMNEAAEKAGYDNAKKFKSDPINHEKFLEILNENIKVSNEVLEELRRDNDKFIITPTTLDIPDFTQDDYAWFWKNVIEELRPTMLISRDWEYSTGSRYEIMDAINANCELYLLGVDNVPTTITHEEVKNIMKTVEN